MNDTEWDKLSEEQKIKTFTRQLALLWKVHPFRDGNTRTTLAFGKQFSKEHGFSLDLGYLVDNLSRIINPETGKTLRHSIRDKFVLAALPTEFSPEPEFLEGLFKASLEFEKQRKPECATCSSKKKFDPAVLASFKKVDEDELGR